MCLCMLDLYECICIISDMIRMSKNVYGIHIDMMVMIERYTHSINKDPILILHIHITLVKNENKNV